MSIKHDRLPGSPVLEGERSLAIYEVTGSTTGSDFHDLIDKTCVVEASRAFDKHTKCLTAGCERPTKNGTDWCCDHAHLSDG